MRAKKLGWKNIGQYWGNGQDWARSATAAGYKTTTDAPVAGSIISWPAGVQDSDPTYGHVGIVESVDTAKGTITTSEKGAGYKVYSRTMPIRNGGTYVLPNDKLTGMGASGSSGTEQCVTGDDSTSDVSGDKASAADGDYTSNGGVGDDARKTQSTPDVQPDGADHSGSSQVMDAASRPNDAPPLPPSATDGMDRSGSSQVMDAAAKTDGNETGSGLSSVPPAPQPTPDVSVPNTPSAPGAPGVPGAPGPAGGQGGSAYAEGGQGGQGGTGGTGGTGGQGGSGGRGGNGGMGGSFGGSNPYQGVNGSPSGPTVG